MSERKTITVDEKTYEALRTFGDKGDTWDELLTRLSKMTRGNSGLELAILNEGASNSLKPILGMNRKPARFQISYEYHPNGDMQFSIKGKCSEMMADEVRKKIKEKPILQYSEEIDLMGGSNPIQRYIHKGCLVKFGYDATTYTMSMEITVKQGDYMV